ncbi:MAG: class A beta-lactamase [Chthoniobacterales bacterium]|nr:class A beta-lactamase [Chthoniobacterales bacterium]
MNIRLFLLTVITLTTSAFHLQAAPQTTDFEKKLAALEASVHGRIGVCALDTSDNKSLCYRANERFPLCSTFKVMDVAAILKKSMTDPQLLKKRIIYTKSDLVSEWNPITEQHVTEGMTIEELCAAAMSYSDNSAANFLANQLGGPNAITAFARSIGDSAFRLDHLEPDLNSAIPGDPQDTTTPEAMTKSLRKIMLGDILSPNLCDQLQTWFKGNTTGNTCIRAGVPIGWVVGDKTGSGDYGTRNDIAVLWPIKGSPIVLSIYFTQFKKEAPKRDEVIAAATKIVMEELEKTKK